MVICHSDLRTVENVSENETRENQNTHFMSINLLSENEAVYVVRWKNVVEQDRSQMAVLQRMRFVCLINNATDTNTQKL